MSRFVRETIPGLVAQGLPRAIDLIFDYRSGRSAPKMDDDAAKHRAVELTKLTLFSVDRPDNQFEVESRWAAAMMVIDQAMAHPDADPIQRAERYADSLRPLFRDLVAGYDKLDSLRQGRLLNILHGTARAMLDSIEIGGRPPGMTYAVAFLSRTDRIILEECRVLCGI